MLEYTPTHFTYRNSYATAQNGDYSPPPLREGEVVLELLVGLLLLLEELLEPLL